MEITQKILAPGVEVTICSTAQFKTGLFSVTLAAPLARDTATAYALAPDVLFRGSRRYPDIQALSAAADRLYGAALGPAVRQRGESQCVGFVCSFIDEGYVPGGEVLLEPALELTGEVLLDPLLDTGRFLEEYVRSEGANLADEIDGRINDKRGWSVFRLTQEMCAGEAYALDKLGSAQEAADMTPERLWTGYERLLEQARVCFFYSGPAPAERVEQAVRRSFAPLLTPRQGALSCQVVPAPRGPVRRVEDRLDVTQGKLALGFRTGGITLGHELYPALLVCNALYGGTAHSKLFLNVREKMSLCYFASSMLDGVKGLMVASSGVEFSDFDRAETAMLEQLEAIRRGDFTREELHAAVQAVSSALRSRWDSQGQVEDDCLTQLLALGRWEDGGALIAAVEGMQAGQVAQAAGCISLDTVYRLTGKEGR